MRSVDCRVESFYYGKTDSDSPKINDAARPTIQIHEVLSHEVYVTQFPFLLPSQVQKDDRLSPKICHACISYLNSWQSFKNRCDAAQKKQRMWMNLPAVASGNALGAENNKSSGNNASGGGGGGGMPPQAAILQQRLLQQQNNTKNQQQLATLLSQNRQITLQPIAPKTNLLQQQLQKQSQPPRQPNLLLNKPSSGPVSKAFVFFCCCFVFFLAAVRVRSRFL